VSALLIPCKLIENNNGMEMANVPRMQPLTNAQQGILQVMHFSGEYQVTNIFTKAVDLKTFNKNCKKIIG